MYNQICNVDNLFLFIIIIITFKVPVPITDKESTFYAMRWFVHCGREKDKSVSFADFMATELINASNNDVRIVFLSM